MKQFTTRIIIAAAVGRCQMWRTSSGISAAGREHHQKFRPAFLKINAESFSEQDGRIKEGEQTGHAQLAFRKCVLQFVQQIHDRAAVMQQQFFVGPIRNLFQPDRCGY